MKWDLTYLFKTEEEYEKAYEELIPYVEKAASFAGKLGDEEKFVEYYLTQKEISEKLERVYQYGSLKSDLNKKNVENASKVSRMMILFQKLSLATSFESPEILSLGKEKVMSFIDKHPELEEFRFGFEKLFRSTEHILDANSEKLISYFSPVSQGGGLYSALAVADGKNETVKLKNKEVVTVTQGNWRSLIMKTDNAVDRKKIFEALYKTYDDHKTTYGTIYNTVLQADKAYAKARNYDSILESFLFRNNIPTSVYKTLVNVASRQNKSLKKYFKLRKKALGLKRHYTYDRFLELAHSNKEYSYEEAKNLFFASIEKFPSDFKELAREALKDGFVDVYEQDGKRTGAYSSGVTNTHPFILLNYSNTLDDVFTVAHEAGHSIHTMYAAANQPGELQNYTIFVAEIASTFNEHALLDYLMTSGNITKEEKIMLLQKAIDEIVGTFYRQTLFADYELRAHELVEKDQPINHEVLSKIMVDLYKQYYGFDLTKEKYKEFVWAYIPHLFYTPFYVYQYATSFAASFKLYKDVQDNVPGAFEKYTNLLKSGGSKYPVEQAREAGVDFTKKETFMAVVERMDKLVDELEKLLDE
ncbi:MAG: oligoendopeptidase F [Bacilli bacterium]|nr:oligoendopeptidase F [Bacilli bacterium]